ncbi:PAR1 protein [Salvia divinorum]|uniref:PAR1 protein n=1 Tax=Salvia divinorum TaxID=28513 RepID=A0ABD1FKE5_SALDI
MASRFALVAIVALAILADTASGSIECESLDKASCAYAVSWRGKRCVLEKHVQRGGTEEYTCAASEIVANELRNWIESDQCVEACGLDRSVLGISSDSLLEARFVKQLCSKECYWRCHNIVDLYFDLAAGEGVYLPKFCDRKGANTRREISEIRSSGSVAVAESPEYSTAVNYASMAPY